MSFADTLKMEAEINAAENNIENDTDSSEIIPANNFEKLAEAEKKQEFLTEKQLRHHIKAIRDTVRSEEDRLRKKYKWLEHQNLIGASIFFLSLISFLVTSALYLKGILSWWITIPLIGISVSFLHELEHDLIHNMYFKGKEWVQHIMFTVIWMTKLSANPWYRKVLHLRHHILSGQVEDMEERFVGLGMEFNWLRAMIAFYPFSNTLIFENIRRDNKRVFGFDMWILVFIINLPGIVLFTALLHAFLGYSRLMTGLTFGPYDPCLNYPLWLWPYVRDIAVLIVLPNLIRQTSLNLVASYCHYYGDIPRHNVYYQNQVLNHWTLLPLHLFCFNFGATHIIHHFVTNQPFYLRQMLAPKATEELIKHGIRNNDFDVIRKNNRYFDNEEEIKKAA
jgi:fatty acid desaturase